MRIESLDHLVLTVADIEATVAFYADVLGMEIVTFAGGAKRWSLGGRRSTCISRAKSLSQRR